MLYFLSQNELGFSELKITLLCSLLEHNMKESQYFEQSKVNKWKMVSIAAFLF